MDGESFPARLAGIDDAGARFVSGSQSRTVRLRDLWRVHASAAGDAMSERGGRVVLLRDVGVLAFDDISVAGGRMALSGRTIGKGTVDVSAVAVVYMPRPDQTAAALRKHHAELSLPEGNVDFLVAEDAKGQYVPFPGALKSIGEGKVVFEFERKDRATDVSGVRIIQLAQVRRAETCPATGGSLVLTDGSVAPFAGLTFDGKKFSATGQAVTLKDLPAEAVAEIRFLSDRLAYLSDLAPAKVVQGGLFDTVFPFRPDRSAAGGALRLAGAAYDKGIGMHARCELTYDLGGRFDAFAATAGIDDSAGKVGDAVLSVRGDGKDLIEPVRLKAGAAPLAIRCKVAGVRELTLLADYGPDELDVGDHVDLAEARLIRP